MSLKIQVIVWLLVLPCLAFSQVSEKGKIITLQGDTIDCLITIDKTRFTDEVKYKKLKEDRFKRFPLSNLYRIVMKDRVFENVFFARRNVIGRKVHSSKLCICLVDGFMKLYKESVIILYHGGEDIVNTHVKPSERDVFYLCKGTGQVQEITYKLFVKQSQKAFNEYTRVVQQIREEKYKYKDLVRIVEDCNESYYSNLLNKIP